MKGQLSLDDLQPLEEPLKPGWSDADLAWFAAGCPLPVPHDVIPLP